MERNRKLAVVAVLLFGLSLYTYFDTTRAVDRFERGQKFLQQLNPDNIATIEITNDGETVELRKQEDRFVVASKYDYPAKNEAINRFIKNILDISLEKEVGASESLQKELQVHEDNFVTQIAMRNEAGNDMVRILLGKNAADGDANFIRRVDDAADNPIYRTSRGIFLTTSEDGFLDKVILDVASGQLTGIDGTDFAVVAEAGTLRLADMAAGKKTTGDFTTLTNALSGLRFDKVFLADDSAVSGLSFDKSVRFFLDDGSSYIVRSAQREDNHYIKVVGEFDPGDVMIGMDESEAELEEKSEVLMRRDEIQDFNQFHGSWIYQVTAAVGKKFRYGKADLVADEADEDSP